MDDSFMPQDGIRDDKSQIAKGFMLEDDRNTQHEDLDKANSSRDISVALNARPSPGDFLRCPRDVDVIGTRKSVARHHPGNVFYRELISRYIKRILDKNDAMSMKIASKKIFEIVTRDKGAVFLQTDENRDGWIVMDEPASINKVYLALKNVEIRAMNGSASAPSTVPTEYTSSTKKRKLLSVNDNLTNTTSNNNQNEVAQIKYQDGPPPPKFSKRLIYEIKEGSSLVIDSYTKEIVNSMCNQPNIVNALSALNQPLSSHYQSFLDEPDLHRGLRLQLRHRYLAAMSAGISPVEFSRKLVNLWGGSILERLECIDKKTLLT